MGRLTVENDRLYLWTLVLALEYEIGLEFEPIADYSDLDDDEGGVGFMRVLQEAV
ncbi:unnamed protein product, partial [Choristocarpus tenellus]